MQSSDYLKYMIYKIVHFIEEFYCYRILSGVFIWLKDDHNHYWLVNASEVEEI